MKYIALTLLLWVSFVIKAYSIHKYQKPQFEKQKIKIEVDYNGDGAIVYKHHDTIVTYYGMIGGLEVEDCFFDTITNLLFIYGWNLAELPENIFTLKIFRISGSKIEVIHNTTPSIVFSTQLCKLDSLYVFGNVLGGLFSMNQNFEINEILIDTVISKKKFFHVYINNNNKIIAISQSTFGEIFSIDINLKTYKKKTTITRENHRLVYAINSGSYLLTKATDSIFIYDSEFNKVYKESSFSMHCMEVDNEYFVIVYKNEKLVKLDFRSGRMVMSSLEISLPEKNEQVLNFFPYQNYTLSSVFINRDSCKINKEIENVSAFSFLKNRMILGVKTDLLIYDNKLNLVNKSKLIQGSAQ